ncbi:MAG: hypothetical protein O2795_17705 [Acidobacteria bacterium]|nr:hypothetical protein [Acidobacteriota bacterium]
MAISTYAELKTAVATWLNRGDLTDRIDEFIDLAESHMDRVLRSSVLISQAEAPVDEEYEDLPSDYVAMIRLYISNLNPVIDLTPLSPQAIINQYPSTTTGRPVSYAVVGDRLQFRPIPDGGAYTSSLLYYRKTTSMALSASNTVNVVLTAHPNIYLYGTLCEAAPFLMDDKMLARYVVLRSQAIDAANKSTAEALAPAAPLVMQHGMRMIA